MNFMYCVEAHPVEYGKCIEHRYKQYCIWRPTLQNNLNNSMPNYCNKFFAKIKIRPKLQLGLHNYLLV